MVLGYIKPKWSFWSGHPKVLTSAPLKICWLSWKDKKTNTFGWTLLVLPTRATKILPDVCWWLLTKNGWLRWKDMQPHIRCDFVLFSGEKNRKNAYNPLLTKHKCPFQGINFHPQLQSSTLFNLVSSFVLGHLDFLCVWICLADKDCWRIFEHPWTMINSSASVLPCTVTCLALRQQEDLGFNSSASITDKWTDVDHHTPQNEKAQEWREESLSSYFQYRSQ